MLALVQNLVGASYYSNHAPTLINIQIFFIFKLNFSENIKLPCFCLTYQNMKYASLGPEPVRTYHSPSLKILKRASYEPMIPYEQVLMNLVLLNLQHMLSG